MSDCGKNPTDDPKNDNQNNINTSHVLIKIITPKLNNQNIVIFRLTAESECHVNGS